MQAASIARRQNLCDWYRYDIDSCIDAGRHQGDDAEGDLKREGDPCTKRQRGDPKPHSGLIRTTFKSISGNKISTDQWAVGVICVGYASTQALSGPLSFWNWPVVAMSAPVVPWFLWLASLFLRTRSDSARHDRKGR